MRLILTALLLAMAVEASAQESLLWRVSNRDPASIVPTYAGQPSPFPSTGPAQSDAEALSGEQEEQRRLKVEALQKAEKLLASRLAITPEMRAISVGGRIEGDAGAKVLVNNQWVGAGTKVWVMVTKSAQAQQAIATLRNYDSEAADELDRRLNQSISTNPRMEMTLQRILSTTLVFSTSNGTQTVPININNNND